MWCFRLSKHIYQLAEQQSICLSIKYSFWIGRIVKKSLKQSCSIILLCSFTLTSFFKKVIYFVNLLLQRQFLKRIKQKKRIMYIFRYTLFPIFDFTLYLSMSFQMHLNLSTCMIVYLVIFIAIGFIRFLFWLILFVL